MNISEQIKLHQDCRKEAADFVIKLKQASAAFYQQLLPVNKFVNNLPNTLLYRKRSLQQSTVNVIKLIDVALNDLKKLDIDCSLQIQLLITAAHTENLREEHERTANARMARRAYSKRRQADEEESSG